MTDKVVLHSDKDPYTKQRMQYLDESRINIVYVFNNNPRIDSFGKPGEI